MVEGEIETGSALMFN